jgi:uncharacterized protein YdeI (YjbR/CyaY-like superfamily)
MDEIMEFRSAKEWDRWLIGNHVKSNGVWIRMFKKDSDVPTVSNSEALDLALCYGWITGQSRPYDEKSWLNRYVPRRPKSIWSKINKERAERLIKEGRMKPAGLAQVEAASLDGRWQRAYTPPSQAVLPADFVKELWKNRKATAFARTLNRANVYSVVFRLENAKTPEKRQEKIRQIVEMFSNGKKLH